MKAVRLNLHPRQVFTFDRERRLHCMSLLLLLLLIIVLHLALLPRLPASEFNPSGFAFDLLYLLPLMFLFWVVQCAYQDLTAYRLLSIGLILWQAGSLIDVLDEILWQPLAVGLFLEDPLRVVGLVLCVFGITRTMFSVSKMYHQLHGMAWLDDLTHLPNRRRFRLALQAQANGPCAVLMIDLDLFKRINDNYGHDVGDEVLQQFAQILIQHCPAGAVAARLGGEEFALLSFDPAPAALLKLAEQIRCAAHAITLSPTDHLTISIGAGVRQENESTRELLTRIDQALYQAKHAGRDRVEWSTAPLDRQTTHSIPSSPEDR